jgi:adenylate cyclase
LMLRYRRESNMHGRRLFKEASIADPSYGRAYAGISRSYNLSWRYRWTRQADACLDRAVELAREAVARDSLDARGYGELGYAYLYRKQHQAALAAYDHAYQLNPNDADLLAEMSDAFTSVGEPDRALNFLGRALRLNPYPPDFYFWHFGEALFDLERYDEAITMLSRMRDPTEGQRLLTASYALLGRMDEARRHAEAVRRAHPNFSLVDWQRVPPMAGGGPLQRFFEGLRLAGLT